MADPTWSYFTFVAKNSDVHSLDESLNTLGLEGWELASSLTTVKTWVNVTGNDLVLVFKKPGANQKPSRETLTKLHGQDPEQAW
jgi:hypothetical protein